MGELHVIFAMLKVIGKYIDASGLDESFIEADIYGPNTLEQITRGKHYKRSIEAFLTLYRTLFTLYIEKFLEENVIIRIEVQDVCRNFLAVLAMIDYVLRFNKSLILHTLESWHGLIM